MEAAVGAWGARPNVSIHNPRTNRSCMSYRKLPFRRRSSRRWSPRRARAPGRCARCRRPGRWSARRLSPSGAGCWSGS